jgi:hypothetical protein
MIPFYSIASENSTLTAAYNNPVLKSNAWRQVTLRYDDHIDDKNYPAQIQLLRPLKWLLNHKIKQINDRVKLSIPEFGINNVEAIVTDIQPATLDFTDSDDNHTDIIIGIFKRYAKKVYTYTFIDNKGNIKHINATPTHPFYVENRHRYVAVDQISPTDKLINSKGRIIKLICPFNQTHHCGKLYNTDGKPVAVYNIEVDRHHHYYVGDMMILVHNICGDENDHDFNKPSGINNFDRQYYKR